MHSIALAIIFAVLMIPGVFAVLVPMLPGIPYLFVVALIYGVIDGFTHLTVSDLALLGGITVFSIIIDQLAGLIGARYSGARGKSLLYGFVGIIIGTIILPFFGGLIGLFLGILIGELEHNHRSRRAGKGNGQVLDHALKAAKAGVLGSLTGMVINFILAVTFFVLFLIFVF